MKWSFHHTHVLVVASFRRWWRCNPPPSAIPVATIEDQLCCSRSKLSLFHTCVGFPACTARFATIVFQYWSSSCQHFFGTVTRLQKAFTKKEMSASRRMIAVWKSVEYAYDVCNIPKVFLAKNMLLCVWVHTGKHTFHQTIIWSKRFCFYSALMKKT